MDFVCTLYEKDYDFGVGALCNSIIKSGFKGKIIVGYKGKTPFWLNQFQKVNDSYQLNDGKIQLELVNLDHIDYHLGYYKPKFIHYCLKTFPNLKTISYFDPDITLKCSWSFMSKWINCGVALATDNCYQFLHVNHPWRKSWISIFPEKDVISRPEFYVNSGFIGLKKEDIELINLWQLGLERYQMNGGEINKFERNAEYDLKGDQDLLNAALMFFPYNRISVIGAEAMGFNTPNYIMGHAISGVKPWQKRFSLAAFKSGEKPSFAEKIYLENTLYPIKLYSSFTLYLKRLDVFIANLITKIL
jgi:hypothetical protein